jgi:hypothetical protein
MKILPVLLDGRPRYLGVSATDSSLLQLPVGHGLLLRELIESARRVTAYPPVVLATFASDPSYEKRIRALAPSIETVTTPAAYKRGLNRYDP